MTYKNVINRLIAILLTVAVGMLIFKAVNGTLVTHSNDNMAFAVSLGIDR